MFSVALIGPDGSGKTTVGRRLLAEFPAPMKYLYMGVNRDSSNRMLPTTWLARAIKRALGAAPDTTGPPDPDRVNQRPRGWAKRTLKGVKSTLSLANRVCEEWYRQTLAWWYQLRGYVVLFDRHYFSDYYAYDIAPRTARPLARRLHGLMLRRLYPKPHLVIYLDAPSDVLFARKREGTIHTLERRRQEYLEMGRHLKHFTIVDANRPADDVIDDVKQRILRFHDQFSRC